MNTRQPTTRAMASLIEDLDPSRLDSLRRDFEEHSELFDTNYILGKTKDTPERESKKLALRSLIETTIDLAPDALAHIEKKLVFKISFARRIRLAGSIIATGSSASFMASAASSSSLLATGLPILAVVGSVAMLVGEHIERPIIGGEKSLSHMLSETLNAEIATNDIRLRLLTKSSADIDSLIELAREANRLASQIKAVRVFSGIQEQI